MKIWPTRWGISGHFGLRVISERLKELMQRSRSSRINECFRIAGKISSGRSDSVSSIGCSTSQCTCTQMNQRMQEHMNVFNCLSDGNFVVLMAFMSRKC
jgi:hypothetical protein